jgi:hypothetical protein
VRIAVAVWVLDRLWRGDVSLVGSMISRTKYRLNGSGGGVGIGLRSVCWDLWRWCGDSFWSASGSPPLDRPRVAGSLGGRVRRGLYLGAGSGRVGRSVDTFGVD